MPTDLISEYLASDTGDRQMRGPLALAHVPPSPKTHNLRQAIVALVHQSPEPVHSSALLGALAHYGFIPSTPQGRCRASAASAKLRQEKILEWHASRCLLLTPDAQAIIRAATSLHHSAPQSTPKAPVQYGPGGEVLQELPAELIARANAGGLR